MYWGYTSSKSFCFVSHTLIWQKRKSATRSRSDLGTFKGEFSGVGKSVEKILKNKSRRIPVWLTSHNPLEPLVTSDDNVNVFCAVLAFVGTLIFVIVSNVKHLLWPSTLPLAKECISADRCLPYAKTVNGHKYNTTHIHTRTPNRRHGAHQQLQCHNFSPSSSPSKDAGTYVYARRSSHT